MLNIRVLLNNFFYRLGWARWRMEIVTIAVADIGSTEHRTIRTPTLVIPDEEAKARLRYPRDGV